MNLLRDLRASAVQSDPYFDYDGDNMTQKVVTEAGQSPVTINFTVNDANELTAMTGLTFTYDAWGRQTEKTDGTYTAQYDYHYGSKMTDVTSTFPTEGAVAYAYGGDQKRRSRDDGTNFTAYCWDIGFNVVEEEDDQGALTKTYVHGGAGGFSPTTGTLNTFVPIVMGPVRRILADVAGTTPGTGAIQHYAHDHLNSTRGIYDSGKNQAGIWEPTPYGEAHTDTLVSSITHRYTGHALDHITGSYHTAYRTYAPTIARWMQRDPLGMVDGPNVYAYVSDSPTIHVDELGLRGFLDCLGICALGSCAACAALCRYTGPGWPVCVLACCGAQAVICIGICLYCGDSF